LYRWDRKDLTRAAALFRQGAQLDDTDSMLSLADMIERGEAVALNINETPVALHCRAAQLGNQSAVRACQEEAGKQERTQQERATQLEQQRMMLEFLGRVIKNVR